MVDDETHGARRFRPARRDVLMGGVGAALGVAGAGSGWGLVALDRASDVPEVPPLQRFTSTQLRAPEVTVWRRKRARTSDGLLFTTPMIPRFQGVIFDDAGSPVWITPDGIAPTDLRVQEYDGRRVLTYWSGEFLKTCGHGKGVILDEHYEVVAEVRAGNGLLADMHEFQLTSRGTALLTAYPVQQADLRAVGGPADGWIWGARVQEIDIATGEVLLDWDGTDHLDLEESYKDLDDLEGEGDTPDLPYDPIHLNSVEADGDALLLSARHTCALYKIDRTSGELVWRFGGKRSDIAVPPGGEFGYQHDLRRHPDGSLTIYDNHEREVGADAVSAALRFRVDEKTMTAELAQVLRQGERYGFAMGNAQFLDDGHVVVGWGRGAPSVTEFDERGKPVFELGRLGIGSYRCYRFPWVGRPRTTPDVGVGHDGSVRVSWNGATEVATWRLLQGPSREDLREVDEVPRDGFETVVGRGDGASYVRADALDRSGEVLARSRVLRA